MIEQQGATHRKDFAKPDVDKEAIMRVMAGEEPEEIATETEQTKPSANSTKSTFKPKKLTKQDYCGQFFKIPNSTASRVNRSMFGRNITKHLTGLPILWELTN